MKINSIFIACLLITLPTISNGIEIGAQIESEEDIFSLFDSKTKNPVKSEDDILQEDLKIVRPGMVPHLGAEFRAVINVRQFMMREIDEIYTEMVDLIRNNEGYDAQRMEELAMRLRILIRRVEGILTIEAPGGNADEKVWNSKRLLRNHMQSTVYAIDMLFERVSFEYTSRGEYLAIESDILKIGSTCRSCHQRFRKIQ